MSDWLDTPPGREMIERAAMGLAALEDRRVTNGYDWERARAALRAAHENPCYNCDGRGFVLVGWTNEEGPCPRCHGSKVDPDPPGLWLTHAEQVGWQWLDPHPDAGPDGGLIPLHDFNRSTGDSRMHPVYRYHRWVPTQKQETPT